MRVNICICNVPFKDFFLEFAVAFAEVHVFQLQYCISASILALLTSFRSRPSTTISSSMVSSSLSNSTGGWRQISRSVSLFRCGLYSSPTMVCISVILWSVFMSHCGLYSCPAVVCIHVLLSSVVMSVVGIHVLLWSVFMFYCGPYSCPTVVCIHFVL